MSISWIATQIDNNLDKFSNSVVELQDRTEKAFQEQQRRISDVEQRPVFDAATIKQLIREVLAEHHLIDQRKDSAGPPSTSPTSSSAGTTSLCARCQATPLCARCHGPVNRSPIILPSFDEISRGVNPMDMTFTPIASNVDPGEAWNRDFSMLSGADGRANRESGEGSNQERRPPMSVPPRTNGVANHQARPVHDYNPNTWS